MKRNRINLTLFILLTCLVMVSACVTNQSPLVQAKSQSTVMLDTYHAAYVDVKAVLTNPTSTPAQRSAALQKRAVLVQIWNILGPYEFIINNGGAPNDADTQAINGLINQLTSIATGGK